MARQRKNRLLPWAMSPSAAAESLGIPLRLIREAIYKDASLPAYVIGKNRVRVCSDDLLAWVKAHPPINNLEVAKRKTIMSDVDKFLLKLDAEEKIREFADTICDTPEKRSAFVRTCGEYLEWNGNRLLFLAGGGTKIPVHHDPNDTAMKFFKEKFNFLLTPEKKLNDQIAPLVPIDPETVALALTGNWTAKGKIARALGDNKEAAELFLKAEAAKGGDRDTAGRFTSNKGDSDNPWSLAGWNVTKQGAVYKSDPALAARLAKAAGSHIGATRATKAA